MQVFKSIVGMEKIPLIFLEIYIFIYLFLKFILLINFLQSDNSFPPFPPLLSVSLLKSTRFSFSLEKARLYVKQRKPAYKPQFQRT